MNKTERRLRRQVRIRKKIKGTQDKPRLSVFRSNRYVYAQLINDDKGITILGISENKKVDLAKKLGKALAEKAGLKKIKKAVFDKGKYKYHGIIKEVAEGAREGGLSF
ncbi:MAG: 50S ribosomal protein L18 [bacterium]|nr:50S ribosomal protein L18 [bacterium]